jgi:hypothetical protein
VPAPIRVSFQLSIELSAIGSLGNSADARRTRVHEQCREARKEALPEFRASAVESVLMIPDAFHLRDARANLKIPGIGSSGYQAAPYDLHTFISGRQLCREGRDAQFLEHVGGRSQVSLLERARRRRRSGLQTTIGLSPPGWNFHVPAIGTFHRSTCCLWRSDRCSRSAHAWSVK